MVLGSGLGAFADTLEHRTETPYAQIPGWPVSTAIGHAGKLVEGRIGDTDVIVLAGRAHLYEGYTRQQVTFGIRETGAPRRTQLGADQRGRRNQSRLPARAIWC